MPTQFVAIIPARYQSTRLPGKPLAMIGNKSMIQRVYEQTQKVNSLTKVVVATDDERIVSFCNQHNIQVQLTNVNHLNGTTRCLEVAKMLNLQANDVVINVQGDEPFISPTQIELLISSFHNSTTQIASLCKQITNEVDNPNIVKVVKDINSNALYFSRSAIPFQRENDFTPHYFKHIGLYAYRYSVLNEIALLPESHLEKSEKLEQLRWLENGLKIQLKVTSEEAISVDTPDDLLKAIEYAHFFDAQY